MNLLNPAFLIEMRAIIQEQFDIRYNKFLLAIEHIIS